MDLVQYLINKALEKSIEQPRKKKFLAVLVSLQKQKPTAVCPIKLTKWFGKKMNRDEAKLAQIDDI